MSAVKVLRRNQVKPGVGSLPGIYIAASPGIAANSRKAAVMVHYRPVDHVADENNAATPLLSHIAHFFSRGMERWRNIQAYFADFKHRPLGGLLQFRIAPVGARPAGDCGSAI